MKWVYSELRLLIDMPIAINYRDENSFLPKEKKAFFVFPL